LAWDGDKLMITRGDEKIECEGKIAAEISDASIKGMEPDVKGKFKFNRVHLFFACIGVLIVVAALGVYFYLVPWIAEKSAAYMPVDLEVRIGEKLAESIVGSVPTDDSVNFYMKKFVSDLDLDSRYPIKVSVLNSPEINAFALPGGRIFIYSGLLEKMNSYPQLVALLGHELTHVKRQHSLKGILRGAAAGIVTGGLFGDFSGLGSWVVSRADEFKQLDYSREMETEADNYGLALMIRNEVDPKGMTQLLELLNEESTEEPALMKYLSTHPQTLERIKNISSKSEMNIVFQENPVLKQVFSEIQASLQRFK
jgi:predicted Zn-dependent protease